MYWAELAKAFRKQRSYILLQEILNVAWGPYLGVCDSEHSIAHAGELLFFDLIPLCRAGGKVHGPVYLENNLPVVEASYKIWVAEVTFFESDGLLNFEGWVYANFLVEVA